LAEKEGKKLNQRSYVTWLTCNWKLKPWLNGGRTRTHDTKTLPCNGSGPRHPHIPSPFRTRQSSPEHSLRKLSDLHAGPVNIWPHFHWNTNTRVNFLAHCTPSLSCPCRRRRTNPSPIPQSSPAIADRPIIHLRRPPGLACTTPARPLSRSAAPATTSAVHARVCLPACEKVPGVRFQTWRARICCGGRRSSTPPSLIPPKVPAFYQEDAHTELAPGSADQMWHLLPLPSWNFGACVRGRRWRRQVAVAADWEEDWSPRGHGHQGDEARHHPHPHCCCLLLGIATLFFSFYLWWTIKSNCPSSLLC